MLSYLEVSYTIGFLVKSASTYNAVELISSNQLKVSIFHVAVPGIPQNINEAIIDHITSGVELNANRL